MKKTSLFVFLFVVTILLSITALSQLGPLVDAVSKTTQVTPAISLEETSACTTTFHDEVQSVYGSCVYYRNFTSCLNTTGPNTDCLINRTAVNQTCRTENAVTRNNTDCKPSKFVVLIDKGSAAGQKEVDFSSWGVCVNSTENNCLAITCGTLKGGSARNGIFNGCDGGKSCQKFLFCRDSIKVLYKASRDDFVTEDPTFQLHKLEYGEVTK